MPVKYSINIAIFLKFSFLAHLSWKLKWAILTARCLSSVRLTVCKLLNFRLLQNHWANFNQTWHKSSLGERILNCSNDGDCPSARGDNHKRVKIHWKFFKIFFSRTSRPISIKLGINHPWVQEFYIVQIKGQVLFKGEIITKMQK
jgi:hypothetical protein